LPTSSRDSSARALDNAPQNRSAATESGGDPAVFIRGDPPQVKRFERILQVLHDRRTLVGRLDAVRCGVVRLEEQARRRVLPSIGVRRGAAEIVCVAGRLAS
jgi:hypothetical protein